MRENTFLLGASRTLVGIVTDPHPDFRTDDRPAVLLLNAGLVHRIGPNRLYVSIARKLAAAGFVVLRFDLSGIGDSEVRRDNLPFEESAVRETQEAMTFLTEIRGRQQFILMGICSGADHALRTACRDHRVVGTVLVDVFAFPSGGYYASIYRKRLFSMKSWGKFITGKSDLWSILRRLSTRMAGHLRFARSTPRAGTRDQHTVSGKQIVTDFHALIQRSVRVCCIYTSGSPAYYNYRVQLKDHMDALPSNGKLQVSFMGESDHTFTRVSNQKLLIDIICNWGERLIQHEAERQHV